MNAARPHPARFSADWAAPVTAQNNLAFRGGHAELITRECAGSGELKLEAQQCVIGFVFDQPGGWMRSTAGGTRPIEIRSETNSSYVNIVAAGSDVTGAYDRAPGLHRYLLLCLDQAFFERASGADRPFEIANHLGPGNSLLWQLAKTISTECIEPGAGSALFSEHAAALLATSLLREHSNLDLTALRPVRGGLAPWQVRRATEYMMTRLADDITLSEVAALCDLSLAHFARAFRQSLGAPPYRWLLERRIERAKELLLDPRQPIAQLALDCGFTEQSHFTKVFSRTVGTSPGAWRRERRS